MRIHSVVCLLSLTFSLSLAGSFLTDTPATQPAAHTFPLADARRTSPTHLTAQLHESDAPVAPPAKLFSLVHYPAAPGKLAAYVTPNPGDGKKHPAIIWIHGGTGAAANSIDNLYWSNMPRDNDQSAAAYRKAGIILMAPSLRGGNNNPGKEEFFCGEVDDILAAADFLAALPYIDPHRIYLGGHSTGGTMVLLAAESTDHFRAVFALGPVSKFASYGDMIAPFDTNDAHEMDLRSPGKWLASIITPTYIFEGNQRPGNVASLEEMRPHFPAAVTAFRVPHATHFSLVGPLSELIAAQIVKDTGPKPSFTFTDADFAALAIKDTAPPTPFKLTPASAAQVKAMAANRTDWWLSLANGKVAVVDAKNPIGSDEVVLESEGVSIIMTKNDAENMQGEELDYSANANGMGFAIKEIKEQ